MAKKNSVPKKQHKHVTRKKQFIEMPKEKFIKICVIVAAVIIAIVLFFVLRSAMDGHLDVVDGSVVTGGDNWLITNSQTTTNPRYFKLAELAVSSV